MAIADDSDALEFTVSSYQLTVIWQLIGGGGGLVTVQTMEAAADGPMISCSLPAHCCTSYAAIFCAVQGVPVVLHVIVVVQAFTVVLLEEDDAGQVAVPA